MPFLILAVLRIAGCTNKKFKRDWIIDGVEIAFAIEQINAIETIVTPAFANFEFWCKFTNDLSAGCSVIDHFDTVLVLLRLLLRQSFKHFQENANVVSFGNSIAVRIYFEAPCQAWLSDERRIRIDNLVVVLNLVSLALSYSWKVLYHKYGLLILWDNVWRKVNADFVINELVWLFGVDFLELADQVARLFN